MRQSKLFTKTRKEAPKDEVAKNAELLIMAGFIHKEMAGVYSYLPLGLRVLNNINTVIREEMDAIGGEEILLTTFQDKTLWEKTGRWDDKQVDIWFKTRLKNDSEIGLGFTHEEQLTALLKDYINSYRDLPVYPYQIQTKFRNEARTKSGLVRGREFIMKDLYSFSADEESHQEFYEKAKLAYKKIFKRVGIGEKTFLTFASGGSFSKYSHEFQTVSEAGEDTVFIDEKKGLAVNKEVLTAEVLSDLEMKKEDLVEKKSIEVGNIFSLGTRFSEALGLLFLDASGTKKPVIMGSYGIGPGRLMGTVVEILSDSAGLIWPSSIAPFKVHLIYVNDSDNEVQEKADALYEALLKEKIDVLYDDRDIRPGEKFADADLIGVPIRAVISANSLKKEGLEIKMRGEEKLDFIPARAEELVEYVRKNA